MASVFIQGDSSTSIGASSTVWYPAFSGSSVREAIGEANIKRAYRTAGTFSNLSVVISFNDRAASTFVLRINGSTKTESVSITGSTTGNFTDATHTDAVTAGQDVNYQLTTGAGGTTFIVAGISVLFAASANTVTVLGSKGLSVTTASTTFFLAPGGGATAQTTEAEGQIMCRTNGTLQNGFVRVTTARATTTTVGTRIAGSNGAISISCTGGVTGVFEDTTNTDTVTAGNKIGLYITTGTGSDTFAALLSVELLTTNSNFITSRQINNTESSATTRYYVPSGANNQTTEPRVVLNSGVAVTASNLWLNLTSNTLNGASTFDLRINSASSPVTLSVGSSTSGTFEDITNTQAYTTTDQINLRYVTGGASGSVIIDSQSLLLAPSSAVVALFSSTLNLLGVG